MTWLLILLSIILLTVVYYVSYFTLAILFRTNNKHYFLGFGNSLFEFKIRDVVFTVAIFIPVFGLARFHKVENVEVKPADYPWQFSHASLWTRLLVTYGGVMALFFSALIILICIKFFVSDKYISREEVNKYGVYPSTLAEEYGFRKGDKVLTVNGQDYESYNELLDPDVYLTAGNTFKVQRDGGEVIIRVPEGHHNLTRRQSFLSLMAPFEIDSVVTGSPADEINLLKGDRIARVNGTPVDNIHDMRRAFSSDVDGEVDLQIQRINSTDTSIVMHEVKLDQNGNLGILTRDAINYTYKNNSFPEAVGKGVRITFQILQAHTKAWFAFFKPGSAASAPASISSVASNSPNWQLFWYLTANYAIIFFGWNFFPFPRSAFWEVIPIAYEGAVKRKYPYPLFRRSRSLAWFIFWALIVVTFVMDMSKLF